MIMNGNTSRSLSAVGWLGVAAFSLLLPLVPIQAQQPSNDDRSDSRDQQIQQLRKALQALEQDQRAVQERRAAEALHRVREQEAQAQRAEQQAKEQLHVIRLQEAQLAQSQDSGQRKSIQLRFTDDKGNPDAQKIERMIEEMARAIEVKRQELRGLEEKLQHAHADLQKMRAEGARAEMELRLKARDQDAHREPIILKIDPNVGPEQIKAQVEAIQGKIKQPIRVEIVSPEKGPVRVRNPTEPEAVRSVERRRDPRGQNLEEKLERIMKEVEELRRELRSSRQQPTP